MSGEQLDLLPPTLSELFGAPEPRKLARSADVETSHAAASHNAHGRASQRAAIMSLHAQHPAGLTDDEVAVKLGDEVWRRCADLRTTGHLVWKLELVPAVDAALGRSERPVTRKARSGRQARVSVIASTE